MNTVYEHTIRKTIKDIYGTDNPVIPNGYMAVEFRPPRVGETYLSYNHNILLEPNNDFPNDSPRIILEKYERKVIKLVETSDSPRHVKPREYWIDEVGNLSIWSHKDSSVYKHIVLEREKS